METSSDRYERLTALGNQLIDIHHRLLESLDDLRAGNAHHDDRAPRGFADEGERPPRGFAGEGEWASPALADHADPPHRGFADHGERPSRELGGDSDPPPRELADHCLAFCAAVTRHHTGEDGTVFPELARRFPELREVLAGLERDHRMMAGMLRRVSELAGALDTDGALAELDGLAALLRSHFTWEEKRLAAALNSLEPGAMVPRW